MADQPIETFAGNPPLMIPVTVQIGVTGQKMLKDTAKIRESIRTVLSRIDQILSHTTHCFVAITSLSEGSDRLLADEVLKWPSKGTACKARLNLVLPKPVDEYLNNFTTDGSKEECRTFLEQASIIDILDIQDNYEEACREIGHTIVHSTDVLIAIWDGKPSRTTGGTGEIIKYARMVGRTLFWIHKDTGKITEERHGDEILESLEYINSFNAEFVKPDKIRAGCKKEYDSLKEYAGLFGLTSYMIKPLTITFIPHFVQVTILTKRYEKCYLWAGTAVYALAAAAIATVAIQILFFPELPELIWLEVTEMAIVLILISVSRLGDWHRKWIDYRYLSERLRTAVFLSVFCVHIDDPVIPGYLSPAHTPNDWLKTAYDEILKKRPMKYCTLNPPFEPLKNFLLAAWINRQIAYYTRQSEWNKKRYNTLFGTGEGLFALTLVIAAGHAIGIAHTKPFISNILIAITIIFPALAASLGGMRFNREYLRNSENYAHMVRHLSIIGNKIRRAQTIPELIKLLYEANEITLREQQERRVVYRFRELDTP